MVDYKHLLEACSCAFLWHPPNKSPCLFLCLKGNIMDFGSLFVAGFFYSGGDCKQFVRSVGQSLFPPGPASCSSMLFFMSHLCNRFLGTTERRNTSSSVCNWHNLGTRSWWGRGMRTNNMCHLLGGCHVWGSAFFASAIGHMYGKSLGILPPWARVSQSDQVESWEGHPNIWARPLPLVSHFW